MVPAALAAVLLSGCGASAGQSQPEADRQVFVDQASQERRERLLERFPGIEVPEVEVIRTVGPTEWAHAQVDCLRAQGFPADLTGDGGVSIASLPVSQEEAYGLAGFICGEQYPLDGDYLVPLTPAQLKRIYAYQTAELMDCLSGEGFALDTPPSFDVFAEGYRTGSVWSPYQDVDPGSQETWADLNRLCPQLPAGLYG